jgi:hypothetical protein
MVEIEIGVLRSQCPDRRIATQGHLASAIATWNDSAMPQAPASNGRSQLQKLAPKWAALTQSPLPTASPGPKSQNHCAAVLLPSLNCSHRVTPVVNPNSQPMMKIVQKLIRFGSADFGFGSSAGGGGAMAGSVVGLRTPPTTQSARANAYRAAASLPSTRMSAFMMP